MKLKVTVRLSYNIAYCINPIWTFVSADIRKGEHNCVYEIYIHFTLMPVPVGRQGAVTFWEGNESHRRVSLPPGTRVEETWGFCCCCCFIFSWLGYTACSILAPRAGIEPLPEQGSNPRPLLLKHGVLTSGPPGKSRGDLF